VGASELRNSECVNGQIWKRAAGVWGCGADDDTQNNEATTEGYIFDSGNALAGPWTVTSAASDINFDANTFVVDVSANRVGIGTAGPAAALGVSGSVTVSGGITAGGTGGDVPHDCTTRSTLNSDTNTVNVSCGAGEILMGGGGNCSGGNVTENYPVSITQWRITCDDALSNSVYARCCAQ